MKSLLKKIYPALILSIFFLLAEKHNSYSQISGGEVFMQGNYIEVGIGVCGGYGSSGLGNVPAVGAQGTPYHPNDNNGLGFVADPDQDGWNVGTPMQCGDYFTPGSHVEGFSVAYDGVCSTGDITNNTTCGTPGSNISYNYNAGTGDLSSVWQGTDPGNGLMITQTSSFNENDLFFVTTVEICNTNAFPITGLRYTRNVDPDNEQPTSGVFTTMNEAVNDADGCAVYASATGLAFGCFIAYGTADPRATAYFGGFNTEQACNYTCGGSFTCSGTNTDDEAIGLFFQLGALAPGECTTLSYSTVLDVDDLDAGISATVDVTQDGDAVTGTANTFNLLYCGLGETTILAIDGGSNFDWVWAPPAGLNTTTGPIVEVTSPSPVTYTATGTPNVGVCSDELVLTFNLAPNDDCCDELEIGSIAPQSICSGSEPNFDIIEGTLNPMNLDVSFMYFSDPARTMPYVPGALVAMGCGQQSNFLYGQFQYGSGINLCTPDAIVNFTVIVNVSPDINAWTVTETEGGCCEAAMVSIAAEDGSICYSAIGDKPEYDCVNDAGVQAPVVYSINPGFSCTVYSPTGIADAPNDNLEWNITEEGRCISSIDFTADPAPHVTVSIGAFVSGTDGDVNGQIDLVSPGGGGAVSLPIVITAGAQTIPVGVFTAPSGATYNVEVTFIYDGERLVDIVVAIPDSCDTVIEGSVAADCLEFCCPDAGRFDD